MTEHVCEGTYEQITTVEYTTGEGAQIEIGVCTDVRMWPEAMRVIWTRAVPGEDLPPLGLTPDEADELGRKLQEAAAKARLAMGARAAS